MSNLSDHIWSAGVAVATVAVAGVTGVAVATGVAGVAVASKMIDEFKPFSALGGGALTLAALFNPTVNFIEKVQPENKTETPAEMVNEQEQTMSTGSISLDDCTTISETDTHLTLECAKP